MGHFYIERRIQKIDRYLKYSKYTMTDAKHCAHCNHKRTCCVVIGRLNPSGMWIMFGEYGSNKYDCEMWSMGFQRPIVPLDSVESVLVCDECVLKIVEAIKERVTYLGNYGMYCMAPVPNQYNCLISNKISEMMEKKDIFGIVRLICGSDKAKEIIEDPKKIESYLSNAMNLLNQRNPHQITSEEALEFIMN
jgi:hypothetical protein